MDFIISTRKMCGFFFKYALDVVKGSILDLIISMQ